ncbi:MAG TPA: hypothetical protein VIB39_00835 [Candidatus Angelobacter sp.]
MQRIRFTRSAWVSLLVIALSMSLLAEVKVELKASKIVVVNGAEQKQSADKAKPGEIIEYVAEYRNTAKTSVSNVVATLPVPPGMEYVPDTAEPAQVMASTDDHNYSPVPLKRSVRGADGKMVEQLVPFSEYRSLRWKLGDIQGGASKSVKARMKVKSEK